MDSDENNNKSFAGSGNPEPFRIFLASPGDVPLERKLAREAITHISSERRFRGRIDIEIIAWDQPGAAVAMEAGLTPQEAIAEGLRKPEDCDLAVIILWSRIGTQLPADFELKEDGTPYLSGTEWEYLNALKGFRSKRKPAVWIYRRQGAPNPELDDPDYASIVDQWKKLQKFFATFNNPDGSLVGGINHYEAPDDFRQQFEQHLRDRLDKLLESLPAIGVSRAAGKTTAAPIWTASPYPGLEAFTPEQAPIFFGRGPEIDQLLQQFASPQVHFVAVVGVSGSGKSSLVKAGLLPRLRTGIIGSTPWDDLTFKPGERGGNPYLALAFKLKSALEISGQTEQEVARAMQADAGVAKKHLADLLVQHQSASELLLVIDQFEELFTLTTADDRKKFLTLIDHIVAQPHVRVIVTLRADFYARAIEEPGLARLLRRDRGTFPLDPPGMSAIHQMIIRPAEAAGVELQDGLAQRLLDDAGEGPGAMALIAFTLNQLYRGEQASAYLSIQAYEAFGGVQGAVQQRAETALRGLSVNSDLAFDEYDLFAAATGRDKPNDEGWGRGNRPVINVSWEDAFAYAQWLSQRTELNYRLPSEAEWEYAARAKTSTARYWHDRVEGETDPACTYANVFDAKNESPIKASYIISWEPFDCEDEFPFTAPVGKFAANDWGLHDILGNVWEWNQDCYFDSYEGAPTNGSPRESTDGSECPLRVLRGGSWLNVPQYVRSADRSRDAPVNRDFDIGFRLARTL